MSESSPLTAMQEHSLETRNHSHFLLKCIAESFELFQAGKQQEAALAFMFYSVSSAVFWGYLHCQFLSRILLPLFPHCTLKNIPEVMKHK